ncbi:TerY-C metal binding domain-containing protein [Mucilaginibacter pedocola]|uniref:VWA domain-containing protein n=1 Tax=Mucilaginibacter pedocola TaxID=1792845 RepID=A0A1S9P701_9SPHI|nr:TerY-C metal binding domain-containing protein [Mucilaginibacter pedocola]OOQ56732.1 VWA domain-containing protein [Mucilaginibacter pedocola]
MRRLPVYFLIDVSESMVGEPIQLVEEGLATIIKALKADPYAIETAWISIIVFAGQAKTLVPLQEIVNFYPPRFPVGSGTSLSKGLGHLMYELRKNIVKTTFEQKGDWKPLVFLFTDGVPTEDSSAAIGEWKRNWQRSANMVAVSFGNEADNHILSQLTENVLSFKNADQNAYKQFFKWVTDSIKTTSVSVESSGSDFELANLKGTPLSKIDLTKEKPNLPVTDNNFVVLAGKCQNSKRQYLIKYRKHVGESDIPGLGLNTLSYRLVGGYQVDGTYEELSDSSAAANKINSSELVGFPNCPSCANPYGVAVCACGKIHCIDDREQQTCPWCGNIGYYGVGDGSMDIGRAQG